MSPRNLNPVPNLRKRKKKKLKIRKRRMMQKKLNPREASLASLKEVSPQVANLVSLRREVRLQQENLPPQLLR